MPSTSNSASTSATPAGKMSTRSGGNPGSPASTSQRPLTIASVRRASPAGVMASAPQPLAASTV
jgi:hypothetical protein